MIDFDKHTAASQINVLLRQAENLLDQATRIADNADISFDWNYLGYGMGGSYAPKPMTYDRAIKIIESGEDLTPAARAKIAEVLRNGRDGWVSSDESGWVSSSSNC